MQTSYSTCCKPIDKAYIKFTSGSQFRFAKASQLSDIVRATLMFKVRRYVIADIYGAIEEIGFMSELNGVRASVTLLDDRFKANKIVML